MYRIFSMTASFQEICTEFAITTTTTTTPLYINVDSSRVVYYLNNESLVIVWDITCLLFVAKPLHWPKLTFIYIKLNP